MSIEIEGSASGPDKQVAIALKSVAASLNLLVGNQQQIVRLLTENNSLLNKILDKPGRNT